MKAEEEARGRKVIKEKLRGAADEVNQDDQLIERMQQTLAANEQERNLFEIDDDMRMVDRNEMANSALNSDLNSELGQSS